MQFPAVKQSNALARVKEGRVSNKCLPFVACCSWPALVLTIIQGFDWEALASRRMDPPRKPKDSDSAKRKSELTEAHQGDAREPTATDEELAEWDKVRGFV